MKMKYFLFLPLLLLFATNSFGTNRLSNDMIFSACEGLDPDSVFTDVNASNIIVSWGPGASTGPYVINYGVPGFAPGQEGFKVIVSDTTSVTIGNLTEDTDYEFYISVDCGAEQSDTIGPIAFRTLFLKDVGISAIFGPVTDCNLGQDSVKVLIRNYGEIPQTLIPFNYMVNGIDGNVSMPQDGLYTGVVSNDSVGITAFDATFNFSAPGEYTIVAWTEFEEDSQISNDTFIQLVTHIPVISSYPYRWDFELWKGGWLPEGTNSSWEFGTPDNQLINFAPSGENAWVTSLAGNYNNNEQSFLVSPCLDFSRIDNDPLFAFAINLSTQADGDQAWVEISTDGEETWEKLGTGETGINWYNDTDQQVWEGDGGFDGWVVAQHIIKGVIGNSEVRLRLVFQSNGTVTGEGFGFDNVIMTPPLSEDLFALEGRHTGGEDCGAAQDEVILTILNNGNQDQNSFELGYQINDNAPVIETVNNFPVSVSERRDYIFNNTFDSTTPGEYDVKVWAKLPGDLNIFNDTVYLQFEIAAPQPLPIEEDFEVMVLPIGWSSTASVPVDNQHNNSSFVMQGHLSADTSNYEVLTSNIGPINAGDSLTFDYRFVNFPMGTVATTLANDKLDIEISTDCGATFTTAATIDASNHVASTMLQNFKVDLNSFAGENIRIRFKATHDSGDYWLDIDNVNIIGCPPNLSLSPQSFSETSTGSADGSIILTPSLGTAPYAYIWDNLSTTDTLRNLATGMYSVTVTDAIGCTDNATISIGTCPSSLELNFTKVNESSQGKEDGQVSVDVGTGTGPYSYSWSNGSTKSFLKNINTGNYTVTVTDVNGCEEIASVNVGLGVSAYQIEGLNALRLSPNPTNQSALLSLDFAEAVDLEIQLFNLV
ncbi:MAG: hypothetical protein AAFO94_08315, partial [Bacteroidota bacterium]